MIKTHTIFPPISPYPIDFSPFFFIPPEKSATELAVTVINCRKNAGANERRLKDQSKQTCACACTNIEPMGSHHCTNVTVYVVGTFWKSDYFEDFVLCMSYLLSRSALCQIQRFELPCMRIILTTLLELLSMSHQLL